MTSPYNSKFETQTPNSTGSMKRKSFSNLLRKNRGDARRSLSDDHSDNSRHSSPNHRYSNHLSTFERKNYNPRKASVASHATSSASSDPSSAAGSAFAQPSAHQPSPARSSRTFQEEAQCPNTPHSANRTPWTHCIRMMPESHDFRMTRYDAG